MTRDAAPQPTLRPWRSIGWWFAGLLFVGIVATIVAGGIVSYRARRQAALVAALKRNGASVFHAAESWNLSDRQLGAPPPPATYVPEWLRKRLGDDFFDVVDSVYAARYVSGSEGLLPLTKQEMQTVCDLSRQLPSIRNFSAKGSSFKLADIASWPHFGKLKCLELMGDNVTDADLVTIGGLSHLERLHIESSQVTDAGLQHLASLTQLQELGIFSETVGDAGLVHLGGLKKIWKLYLGCPQIGDAGVLSLSPANLRRVSLRDCQVGDRGLSHLVSGGNIERLSVVGTRITDACLADVAKCKYLHQLVLIKTQVTGVGFSGLSGSHLEFLHLDESPITDKGLEHLGSLGRDKRVIKISLRDTQVTGAGASYLTGYEFISYLDLAGTPLTRDGIEQLAKVKVSNLNVSRTSISDEDLLLFVGMDDTSELDVRQTKVTPLGVRRFMDAREKRCIEAITSNSLRVISDFNYDELPPSELKPEGYPLPSGIPAEVSDAPITDAADATPPSPKKSDR